MKLTLLQAQFVRLAQETDYLEYRFRGDLGFGGKVYVEDPPRVACYPEDETPERNRKIENANGLLRKLWNDLVLDR